MFCCPWGETERETIEIKCDSSTFSSEDVVSVLRHMYTFQIDISSRLKELMFASFYFGVENLQVTKLKEKKKTNKQKHTFTKPKSGNSMDFSF
jgi:hypothetical protein